MTLPDPHLIIIKLLVELKNTWRLPLQIEQECELFEKALGIESLRPRTYEELTTLCQQLWGKSPEEKEKIGKAFKQHFEKEIKPRLEKKNPEFNPPKTPSQPSTTSQSSPTDLPTTTESKTTEKYISGEVNLDEEVVAALPQLTKSEPHISKTDFIRTDEYFDLNRAQLTKGWASLRKSLRTGKETELDIPATVKTLCEENIAELVYRPCRENQVELLLLIDKGDSMTPFSLIGERLAETAEGIFKSLKVFYFRNSPRNALFADPELLEKHSLDKILTQLNSSRPHVLIFSDGGAREIIPSEVRINLIQNFIELLQPKVQQILWLNPLPKTDWLGTSAEKISKLPIPMFPFSVLGWQELLRMLRGKTVTPYPHRIDDDDTNFKRNNSILVPPLDKERLGILVPPLDKGGLRILVPPLDKGGLGGVEEYDIDDEETTLPRPDIDDRSLDALDEVLAEEERLNKYEEAIEILSEFAEDFPEYVNLAFHAAFPLAITPDLLYYFRENFLEIKDLPWIAVGNLLLSSLFESIGGKLYQMDSGLRHLLLKALKNRFGNERLNELSDALLSYLQQGLEETIADAEEIGEEPGWIALGYTQPTELAKQLAARLQKSLNATQEDKIKTASLTATFAEALPAEFQPLLKLARGVARQARGYEEGAQEIFRDLPPEIDIAGVKLKVPGGQKLPLKTA
ncbi:MAG TPA: hypothetical protein VK211_15120 [Kamptonema sp.]|nr:hypothetical protein [Kamptonema sp.]